jgi:hypothetical protein
MELHSGGVTSAIHIKYDIYGEMRYSELVHNSDCFCTLLARVTLRICFRYYIQDGRQLHLLYSVY